MNEEEKIRREVDETLHSLDDWTPAEADDFFYARLEHRMTDEGLFESEAGSWFVFAAAAVILLVLANIFTLQQFQQVFTTSDESQETDVAALAEDYQVDMPVIYELNAQE